MSVGKQIKLLRVELEISQNHLAKLLGVTATAVYNWESNRKKLSVKMAQALIKIAKEKGITLSLDQLFKED